MFYVELTNCMPLGGPNSVQSSGMVYHNSCCVHACRPQLNSTVIEAISGAAGEVAQVRTPREFQSYDKAG
jgi:hypothetical protein